MSGILGKGLFTPIKRFPLRKLLDGFLFVTLLFASLGPQPSLALESPNDGSAQTSVLPAMAERYQSPVFIHPAPIKVDQTVQNEVPESSLQSGNFPAIMFVENVGQFDKNALFQTRGDRGAIYFTQDALWISLLEAPSDPPTLDLEQRTQPITPELAPEGGRISPTPTPGGKEDMVTGVNLRLTFVGANAVSRIEGFRPLDTTISYFDGKDPDGWHADVPVWSGIRYTDYYPGYDLEVTSQAGQWNWQLAPTGNALEPGGALQPNQNTDVRLRIEGAEALALEGDAVRITTAVGDLLLPLPKSDLDVPGLGAGSKIGKAGTANTEAYLDGNEIVLPLLLSTGDGQERPNHVPGLIETPFSISDPFHKSANLAAPAGAVLHIDSDSVIGSPLVAPLLEGTEDLLYSTFLGSGDGVDIVVDSTGAAFIVGTTTSTSFPTTSGAYQTSLAGGSDVYVTKLNASGSDLVYSTYIGGSAADYGTGIALDGNGAVYVTGRTWSTNYPTTSGAYDTTNSNSEAFITKLNSSGTSLGYSTYLGVGGTQGFRIAVNGNGEAYVVGQTAATTFPTTSGAFDQTHNGGLFDGFVTRFNASGTGLVFSTFIGGSGVDCEVGGDALECDIALGPDGSVYIAGPTLSSSFPTTTGAYDRTYNGSGDVFVLRLNPNGGSLIYSTYLGGSSTDDCEMMCSIAVDSSGYAYVTGTTRSSNFPKTTGAFDESYNGGRDAFVTKLRVDGSGLVYSTFLGTTGNDQGRSIAVTAGSGPVVIGTTTSSSFPTSPDAFQSEFGGGPRDAFYVRFSINGDGVNYSSFLGGAGDELGYGITTMGVSVVYVTGWTSSGDFPTTEGAYSTSGSGAFVSKLAGNTTVVYELATLDAGLDRYCCQSMAGTFGTVGSPINTQTGGEFYQVEDISIPTSAGLLAFQRSYSSLATDLYTTALGYGWTHSLDSRLILPDDPDGEEGYVLFKASSANRYQFIDNGDDTYSAASGVIGTLTFASSEFTLTLPNQSVYTFDDEGVLLTWADAQGHTWEYTYSSGRLTQIDADGGDRYLALTYDGSGRIATVADQTERGVTFDYDGAGDLVSVIDVMAEEWTYDYDAAHHLTEVIDPLDDTVERSEYDGQGRAIRQWDGLDNLVVEITYNSDGTRTIEDALENIITHTYDSRKTLVESTDPLEATIGKEYDTNFRPVLITDALGNSTQLSWSEDGANLTRMVDAEGNETDLTYDELNNPIAVVDALDYLTTYDYNGTLLSSVTDALDNETVYTYTVEGFLESITDPLSNTISYTYDEFGQREAMTDALENTWTYEYDDQGRLTDTTDPLGRVTHNEYDAAGRLIRITQNYDALRPQNDENQFNIVTEYDYNAAGQQVTVTDTYNRTTSSAFDDAGRLISTTDPDQNVTTYTYNVAGQLVATTDALDRITEYAYDEAGRLISTTDPLDQVTETTYNPDGTVASTLDALERETSYEYDSLGRVIAITQADSSVIHHTYDEVGNQIASTDALGKATTYEYDALGRLIKETDPLDGETEHFYDEAGNLIQTIDPRDNATTYEYDDNNRLLSVTDALGNVTAYEYDDLGRRTAVIDALEGRTEYTYDELDRVIAVTDPLEHTINSEYDARGQVISQTDANDNTTTFEYDDLGRLVERTDPLDDVTTYTYDAVGNLLTVTDPNEHTTTTEYDALNRPISVTDANNNATTTTYDAVGNILSVEDALENTTSFTYNSLNQQTQITDPLANETHYLYNSIGDLVLMTDAEGVVTRYQYDDLGHLIAVTENYLVGIPADEQTNVRTEYTYDANGNRLTIADGNEHVTTFTYDELNRLVSEIDPLSHTWTYEYDDLGNRVSMTDANSVTTVYTYDAASRLTGINYPGSSADVSFTYDAGGHRTGMTDSVGITTWVYDDLNRVLSITDPFDETVAYDYDAVGNRTSLTYPNAQVVNYDYDPMNHLLEVTSGVLAVAGYEYDAAGRLTAITRANDVDTTYGYDNAGQLLSILHADGTETVASYEYAYDNVGNRIQAVEEVKLPPVPPSPTPTITLTPTVTLTPSATTSPTQTPSPTETPSPTLTPSATPTASPNPTETLIPSPTPPPGAIVDEFDGSLLGSDWEWYVPAIGPTYSLDDEPDHLRLVVPPDRDHWGDLDTAPQVRRNDMGPGDWAIETHLELGDANAGDQWQANLEVGFDRYDQQWLSIGSDDTLRVTRVNEYDTAVEYEISLPLYLRIEKSGTQYTFRYKEELEDPWTTLDTQSIGTEVSYIGLQVRSFWTSAGDVVLDMDYFRLERTSAPDPGPDKEVEMDEFNSLSLAEDWNWYVPKTGPTYSLSAVSGVFRMILPEGDSFEHWVETDDAPQLRREDLGEADWAIETELVGITAENAAYWGALEVGFDQYDQVWYGLDDGSYLKAIRVGNCCPYFETPESMTIILRLEKHGEDYIFKYKHDPDEAWTAISPISIEETPVYVGLISRVITTGDEEMNLDWSYFRLERWEDEENFMLAPEAGEDSPEIGKEKEPVRGDDNRPTSTPTRQPTATITRTPSPTGTATPQAIDLAPGGPDYAVHFAPVGFNLPAGNGLPHENRVSVGPLAVPRLQTFSQTIDYTYDPLYRLTDADYSNGDFFQYTYDAVGNRLLQESSISSLPSEVDYLYDAANRLIDVNNVEYTWDDNGNLIYDEVDEYTYDGANRLSSVSGAHESSYVYNGRGDRLQQTVDSNTTTYVLDLNAGLTQVLEDGTYSYTYGLSRILQDGGSETEYFLGDALGSVRQLADESAGINMAKAYDPYGSVLYTAGSGTSEFAFTGEQTDMTGMVYLRARYYSPSMGRFITKDIWDGNQREPISLHEFLYSSDNPIVNIDPSGMCDYLGWNNPPGGLFSEKQCDDIMDDFKYGDGSRIEEWYYKLAERMAQDGNKQASANLIHFLDGSGSQLQLYSDFMQKSIWGWGYISGKVNNLADWYVRSKVTSLEGCNSINVGPDGFARFVDVTANNPEMWLPWNWPSRDAYGSLGSFRLDVVISGQLNRPWKILTGMLTEVNLNLHIVVIDYYNWHKGVGVTYPGPISGANIPDQWARFLLEKGKAHNFLVRGDIDIPHSDQMWLVSPSSQTPPSGWVRASCIGIGFEGGGYSPEQCAPGPVSPP